MRLFSADLIFFLKKGEGGEKSTHISLRCALQCRGRAHRNVHRHRQHAATDQGQKHSQRPGFSQTYTHTTQLPCPDGGKALKLVINSGGGGDRIPPLKGQL